MNSDNSTALNSKRKILVIYVIVTFILESFYRERLYLISVSFQEWLQPRFGFLSPVCSFLSDLAAYKGIFIINLAFFNYQNVFKTFILLLATILSAYLYGFLKMAYSSPRPFWTSEKITPFDCEGGWGNPSGHALNSTVYFLSLWRLLFVLGDAKYQEHQKKSLYFFIALIIAICFSRVLLGVHSLDQILFGSMLGYGLYYFIFEVLDFNSNDPSNLIGLFRNYPLYCGIIFIMYLLAFLPFQFAITDEAVKSQYDKRLSEKCPWIIPGNRFEYQGLRCTALLILILPALLGIHLELTKIFHSDESKWSVYNFSSNHNPYVPLGTASKNLIDVEGGGITKQWNETTFWISLKRFLFLLVFFAAIMFPFSLLHVNDYTLSILIKQLLPISIIFVLMFSYLKEFMRYFKLTNDECFKEREFREINLISCDMI